MSKPKEQASPAPAKEQSASIAKKDIEKEKKEDSQSSDEVCTV